MWSSVGSSENHNEPFLNCTYRAHKGSVNYVSFDVYSSKMVTCANDHHIIYWDLIAGTEIYRSYRLIGHKDVVNCVDFSPDNSYFISCSRDKTVCLWRIVDEKLIQDPIVYNCHSNTIRSVSVSPSNTSEANGGEYFATASDDKSVKVWSSHCKNKQVNLLRGHTNWVRCCKYCPNDDRLIASCGDDSSIIIHDLRVSTGCPEKISKNGAMFTSLDWYPSNRYLLAASSQDGKVRLFDLRTGKTLQYYHAHASSVNHIKFHPCGNYLLSASDDSSSKIFDLLEGRVVFTLRGHDGPVNCANFTPNGKIFATVGHDSLINLWNSNLLIPEGKSYGEQVNQVKPKKKSFDAGKKGSKPSRSNSLEGFDVRAMLDGINPFKSSNPSPKKDPSSPTPLDRIIDQLDILAQSLSNLEDRVALVESKLNIQT